MRSYLLFDRDSAHYWARGTSTLPELAREAILMTMPLKRGGKGYKGPVVPLAVEGGKQTSAGYLTGPEALTTEERFQFEGYMATLEDAEARYMPGYRKKGAGSLSDTAADLSKAIDEAAKAGGVPTTKPGPQDVWIHEEPDTFEVVIPHALLRADLEDWNPGGAPLWSERHAIEDLRALIVAGLFVCDRSSTKPAPELSPAIIGAVLPGPDPYVAPAGGIPPSMQLGARVLSDYAEPTIGRACVAIQAGWSLIAQRLFIFPGPTGEPPPPVPSPIRWATMGAGKPIPLGSGPLPGGLGAAGWPLAVAVIAGIGALTYLGGEAIAARERLLAHEEDSRRLVKMLAAATDVVGKHQELDAAAGKTTPLTAAEQTIVDSLGGMVKDYGAATKAREAGKPASGPLAGVGEALGGAAALVAVAAVAYLVLKR
jgi:hypothetical protein